MLEEESIMDIDGYYDHICQAGRLRTVQHARRWSDGVLRTFGTALNRKTKRDLAKALPDELAESVKDVFWLLHFRDPNLSSEEFLQRAARRSGNSNSEFAVYPTLAVFSGVRMILDQEMQTQVAESLSPQVRDLWEQAG
jgi:uncharacterized protein (DUF2267 family)